ncbi:MAG: hypothetical protein GY754_35330 [bacterium]|nr:hypothetical protein [bacterium]
MKIRWVKIFLSGLIEFLATAGIQSLYRIVNCSGTILRDSGEKDSQQHPHTVYIVQYGMHTG